MIEADEQARLSDVADEELDRGEAGEAARKSVSAALVVAERYGMVDGAHHKQWVIDQMIRALLGDGYAAWRKAYAEAPDAAEYEPWDEGIGP